MKKIINEIKEFCFGFIELFNLVKRPKQKKNTIADTINKVQAQKQLLKQQQLQQQMQYQQQMQVQQQRQQLYQNMMQIQQELFDVLSRGVYGIISTPSLASHIRPSTPLFRNDRVCYIFSFRANAHPVTQQDEKQLQIDINQDINQFLISLTALYGAGAVAVQYPLLSSGFRVRMVRAKGRTVFLNIY